MLGMAVGGRSLRCSRRGACAVAAGQAVFLKTVRTVDHVRVAIAESGPEKTRNVLYFSDRENNGLPSTGECWNACALLAMLLHES
jgi:hypothetical protein